MAGYDSCLLTGGRGARGRRHRTNRSKSDPTAPCPTNGLQCHGVSCSAVFWCMSLQDLSLNHVCRHFVFPAGQQFWAVHHQLLQREAAADLHRADAPRGAGGVYPWGERTAAPPAGQNGTLHLLPIQIWVTLVIRPLPPHHHHQTRWPSLKWSSWRLHYEKGVLWCILSILSLQLFPPLTHPIPPTSPPIHLFRLFFYHSFSLSLSLAHAHTHSLFPRCVILGTEVIPHSSEGKHTVVSGGSGALFAFRALSMCPLAPLTPHQWYSTPWPPSSRVHGKIPRLWRLWLAEGGGGGVSAVQIPHHRAHPPHSIPPSPSLPPVP